MTRPNFLKISKGLAFAGGGLVAVLVLAAFIAAMLFDGEAVKVEAAQFVKAEKHRTLRIDGDLRLSFWPGIGLRMTKATLSERDSEQPFVAVGRARLSLRLLPLLRKELAVDTVELEGVNARVLRYKDGSFNFDDLISAEKDKPPLRFDVAGLRVSKGALTWIDEGAERTVQVVDLEVSAERLANVSEGRLNLAGKLTADRPALVGQIRGEAHYRIDLDHNKMAFDGLALRYSGDLAGNAGSELMLASHILGFGSEGMEATKLELAYKSKSPAETTEARLEAPMIKFAAGRSRADTLSFSGTIKGPRRTSNLNLNLSKLDLDGRHLKAGKLAVNAEVRQGEDSYQARLASPMEADTTARTLSLPQLGGELEINNGALPMKQLVLPVKGSFQVDLARTLLSTAITTRLEDAPASARVDLTRFSPPAISFGLDFEKLNGDRYVPKRDPSGGKNGATEFALPSGLDASGIVKIGSLQYAGVRADNLRLDLSIKDGKLEWSPLALSVLQNLPASVATSVQGKAKEAVDLSRQVGSKLKGLLGR